MKNCLKQNLPNLFPQDLPQKIANGPKTEELFLKALSKMEQFEDPLKIFLDYIKWLEENGKNNQIKIFELLEKMTKTFFSIENYKQDERFLKKWLSYANSCSDSEEILVFMKENEIGMTHTMFYEVFAIVYEKKRDFQSTNKILLEGLLKKAHPTDKMVKLLKEFEERMLQRLDRDFYSQGLTLKEEIPINFPLNSSKINNENVKKRKLCENNGLKELPLKKIKLLEEKAREIVKIGDIDIFVDEQFRKQINISTQLVDEYLNLCKKYNFWKEAALNFLPEITSKPLSWITKENFLYKLELSDNLHRIKEQPQQSFERKMPKISEESCSMGSSEIIHKNIKTIDIKESPLERILMLSPLERISKESPMERISKESPLEKDSNKSLLEKKHSEKKISTKKEMDLQEKENFIKYFSKKIEENINEFFILPKSKKIIPLHSSQKKNAKVFFSSTKKKNLNTQLKEESPIQINFKLNFEELRNTISNKKEENKSFSAELEETQNISFEKFSGFFSDEKDKFLALSLIKEKFQDSPFSEIEIARDLMKLHSDSPKRKIDCNLNMETSFIDNAFLMDSNQKNLSKDDLVNLLNLLDDNYSEKENVLKIKNGNERKINNDRKALQELPIEEFKPIEIKSNFVLYDKKIEEKGKKESIVKINEEFVKENKNVKYNFEIEEDDFNDFFRNEILNSGLSVITQRTTENSLEAQKI